jgi:thioredoxin reductase (NADPH)
MEHAEHSTSPDADSFATYDVVVIGAGPAGLAAALYSARAGFSTLVLERQMAGGRLAMAERVENYPGFEEGIGGFELVEQMKAQAARFGAELREIEAVERLQVVTGGLKQLQTASETYGARAVVVASGFDNKGLDCPGEDTFRGRGVSFCATCDGPFFRDKVIAVVGGGNAAAEEALVLTRFASKVYMLDGRPQLHADQVYRQRVEEHPQIEVLPGCELRQIRGAERVQSMLVEFMDRREERDIPVDGVFFYVGRRPNTAFLEGIADLDDRGFVLTDEHLATGAEGVFAAGDCRANELKQVVWAAAEGALAAQGVAQYLERCF